VTPHTFVNRFREALTTHGTRVGLKSREKTVTNAVDGLTQEHVKKFLISRELVLEQESNVRVSSYGAGYFVESADAVRNPWQIIGRTT
jgi:hypothetical protein